jgi:hypothetical protein
MKTVAMIYLQLLEHISRDMHENQLNTLSAPLALSQPAPSTFKFLQRAASEHPIAPRIELYATASAVAQENLLANH